MDKNIKAGETVLVKTGRMAGTYATVMYVIDTFVYLRHPETNAEFRCNIKDVWW